MNRGKIILTSFPFTDLSSNKKRPALVVSKMKNVTGDVLVAFISSVVPVELSPTDYLITIEHHDFKQSGLNRNSIIKSDKLATINERIIDGELGFLSLSTMDEINKKLKMALDLS